MMKQDNPEQPSATHLEGALHLTQYTPPAVIYDGAITTRAGSPLGGNDGNGADGIDPADLFN